MAHTTRSALLALLTTACVTTPTPPPSVEVTSPQRGMVQAEAGMITVTGKATPGESGSPIAKVVVNNTRATLHPDGTFSANVIVPPGAMLIETTATSEEGGHATDARAVQAGELRPVGSNVERALAVSISADAFARLATAAGPLVQSMNLAPLIPDVTVGDSFANATLTIQALSFGSVHVTLVPSEAGLMFSAEIGTLSATANAHYTLVGAGGNTAVTVTADTIVISGTLGLAPNASAGFATTLTSPTVRTTNLDLKASGLVGTVYNLLDSKLDSTVQSWMIKAAEAGLGPIIDKAFGALAAPRTLDVGGHAVEVRGTPSSLTFSRSGATAVMNVAAKIQGSEGSPGFVFTPNGTPALPVGEGVQIGLADDLVNEMLAQVDALQLLDLHLDKDLGGLFDAADFKLSLPPMISATNDDGKLRLVLGDMIASFSNGNQEVVRAAINAQVDVEVTTGNAPDQIALQLGETRLFVNLLDTNTGSEDDVTAASGAALALQLKSLDQFLITVPVPSIAGVSFDTLALRADAGYVMVSGNVR